MPSANDVDLVRVFTRTTGSTTAETALPFNAAFVIAIEAEAGSAIFAAGAQFAVTLVVRDLSDGTFFTATPTGGSNTPNPGANANLNTIAWPAQIRQFLYTITAPGPAKENHLCDVLASVRAGVTNPDVEFAESPLFIIIRP